MLAHNRARAAIVWCGAAVSGIAFGASTSAANVFGSAYGPFTEVPGEGVGWLQFLSTWLGSLWAWALFPFAVGWIVYRRSLAVISGTGGLLAAVAAYYLCDAVLGMTNGVDRNALVLWAQLALVAGPVMGLAGAFARGTRFEHLLAGLVAPAAMTYVTTRTWGGSGPAQPWSSRLVLCAAATLAVLLCWRFVRHQHLRFGEVDERPASGFKRDGS